MPEIDPRTFEFICNDGNVEPTGSGLLQKAACFDWGPPPIFVRNMSQSYNNKLRRQQWEAASDKSKVLSLCVCVGVLCVCFPCVLACVWHIYA